jgi:phage terminase large subunit GpA-like protein
MRPPPNLDPHEWAERNLTLPKGTTPEEGRWHSRPYQVVPLRELGNPKNTDGVLYVAASQGGGKTAIALVAKAYFIAADPSPQIFVTYSVEMAEQLSKHRVSQIIRANPDLAARVAEARSRFSNNTIRDKVYPGGALTMVGANSAGGLSMHPKRVLIADEIDRWKPSAGKEGSPLELALTRLKAYKWNARKLYVTSPGIKRTSESWALWQRSDQREWTVPCPDCDHDQVLKWSQVHWDKDAEGIHKPETATYACERCGSAWGDFERWRASSRGQYVASARFQGLVGCRVSALAIDGWTLEEIVKQWIRAQGNPESLKVFLTTVLCEWWVEDGYETLDEAGLMARREPFEVRDGRPVVPAGAALITAGVDVQENRLEITVDAWGIGEECWRLAHEVIFGDPTGTALWDDLDAFLMVPWPRAMGGVDYIRAACVDTGGTHTQQAYLYCGPRFRRPTPDGGRQFVFAIKGTAGKGELWPRSASKATVKVPLWPIRVDVGKEQIYGRLAQTKVGPGYVHFPEWFDKKYFEGLTAEKIVPRTDRKGYTKQVWEKKVSGGRNEPLDCAVYSYAALCGLQANGFDLEAEVARLPQRLIFSPGEPAPAPAPQAAPQVASGQQSRPRGGDSWLGDTRDWLRGR